MQRRTAVRCRAKINLMLAVTGRRDDGYHDIITLLQPVTLSDEIRMETCRDGINLSGDDPTISWDETNLCHRAAASFMRASGFEGGVRMEVTKRIPHGAGLGGGSSDAAGVLAGMNEITGRRLSARALSGIALETGSDVPFFLLGGPAVARGRGELLERSPGLEGGYLLIVKPPVAVSTRRAYDNLKIVLTREEGEDRLNCLLKGLKDPPDSGIKTWNSFESLAAREYPEIRNVLDIFRGEGAALSSLTGSGSACFALFDSEKEARRVEGLFEGEGSFTCLARPVKQALQLFQWE